MTVQICWSEFKKQQRGRALIHILNDWDNSTLCGIEVRESRWKIASIADPAPITCKRCAATFARPGPKYLQEAEKRLAAMTVQQLVDEVETLAEQADYDGELHGEDLARYKQAEQILRTRIAELEAQRDALLKAGEALVQFDQSYGLFSNELDSNDTELGDALVAMQAAIARARGEVKR